MLQRIIDFSLRNKFLVLLGTLALVLTNGKVLSGIKVLETETTLTLADNQGQKHVVAKADIEEQRPSPVRMPESQSGQRPRLCSIG